MNPEHVVNRPLQVFAAVVLLAFLAIVLRLIRAGQLSLRDSLSWFVSTALALVVSVFPTVLHRMAETLGFQLPANALFALAFLYVLINLLALTVATSGSAARLRRLTQECALLRAKLDRLEHAAGGRAPVAGPATCSEHVELNSR